MGERLLRKLQWKAQRRVPEPGNLLLAVRGPDHRRAMEGLLQHRTTAQFAGLPTASPESHLAIANVDSLRCRTGHPITAPSPCRIITLKLDHQRDPSQVHDDSLLAIDPSWSIIGASLTPHWAVPIHAMHSPGGTSCTHSPNAVVRGLRCTSSVRYSTPTVSVTTCLRLTDIISMNSPRLLFCVSNLPLKECHWMKYERTNPRFSNSA